MFSVYINFSDPIDTNSQPKIRKVVKKLWSPEESEAVTKFFRVQIKNRITPGKKICEECIKTSNDVLRNRTWRDVKYYVKNQIARQIKIKI